MTEEEWLTSEDPIAMLKAIDSDPNHRKATRVILEVVRQIDDFLPEHCRDWLGIAERYAEEHASGTGLDLGWEAVEDALNDLDRAESVEEGGRFSAVLSLCCCSWQTGELWPHGNAHFRADWASQAVLVREVFGNPFRPVAVDPAWLTSTVVALAAGVYEERAFDRLPILADALQDAGCEQPDILAHCREPGPHVRGCWVVDLVLGKS